MPDSGINALARGIVHTHVEATICLGRRKSLTATQRQMQAVNPMNHSKVKEGINRSAELPAAQIRLLLGSRIHAGCIPMIDITILYYFVRGKGRNKPWSLGPDNENFQNRTKCLLEFVMKSCILFLTEIFLSEIVERHFWPHLYKYWHTDVPNGGHGGSTARYSGRN